MAPHDDHLMSEGDKLELQGRSVAKAEREQANESRQNGDHAVRPRGDRAKEFPSFPDSTQF